MSKREILAGSVDQTIDVFIQDSSSTTGQGLAALVFNSAGLACYYRKGATGSATALTLATQTVGGAHSNGGFVEIQATNMKGVYRLDLSDTIVDTAGMVTIMLYGATNMAPTVAEIEVVSVNKFDSVRMGMTALPNAAAQAAGGLYTRGTGAGQINQPANGLIDVNVENWNATAVPGEHTAGYPVVTIKGGTGTGEINTNAGAIALVDLVTTTTTVTNQLTAAQIATGVWQDATAGDFTTASSIGKALYINNVAPGGAGGLLISGSNAGTTTFAALTVTGALTAGSNAIPWNAAYDAEVQSEVIDALQETIPDSIPADGTRPNCQAALYMICQGLFEGAISGTTWTIKKVDGTTTLFTETLDSATTPTSKTRAT